MMPSGMTVGTAVLVAEWAPPMIATGVYLAGALLAGAAIVALINRWRRRAGPGRLTPGDQLAQFRSLYEQGAISQEEFARLRALLGGQLRQAVLKAPAPEGRAEPRAEPPGPPSTSGTAAPTPQSPPAEGIRPG